MEKKGRQYLYKIVYDTLKKEILEEAYNYGALLPSEREISIRFDVDRITVRKALEMLVSDKLVEKRAGVGTTVIYELDKEVKVEPNSTLIGFFIVEDATVDKKIAQPFYSDLFYHVENQCKEHNANLIYSTIRGTEDLISMISSRNFSGIVFASKVDEMYIKIAEDSGIKVAQILGYCNRGLTIRYDSAAAGKIAIDYLVEKGHKNIAFITGPGDFGVSSDRVMGVLSAMFTHELDVKKDQFCEGNWEYEGGYNCAQRILAMKKDFSAIYSFNDMMAIGAIQAINDAGIRVPDDISVIGNDNMSNIRPYGQLLTTIDSNIELLAHEATNYFFSKNVDYPCGTKIIIPVTFIEGDTVKKLV
jgi:DNA-binding LacI/PurR family transcriptional regulator